MGAVRPTGIVMPAVRLVLRFVSIVAVASMLTAATVVAIAVMARRPLHATTG